MHACASSGWSGCVALCAAALCCVRHLLAPAGKRSVCPQAVHSGNQGGAESTYIGAAHCHFPVLRVDRVPNHRARSSFNGSRAFNSAGWLAGAIGEGTGKMRGGIMRGIDSRNAWLTPGRPTRIHHVNDAPGRPSRAQRVQQQRWTAATGAAAEATAAMALAGRAFAAHALLVCYLVTGAAAAADSALGSSSAQVSAAPAHYGQQPQVTPARRQQQQQQLPAGQRAPLQSSRPYVIAHRGASGMLPEHTLPAYAAAIEQGADFIECDVEVTADLQLVCRHEPNVNDTTNAWQLFRERATTHVIDGERVSGIFTSDLTLAEVQRLRARQPWPFRDQSFNNEFAVPTLQQFLDLAAAAPRVVGVYPETKHPSWHNSLPALRAANTTIEQLLVAELHAHGYGRSSPLGSPAWRAAPVLLQSFEASSLRRLAALTDMPRVLLMGGWPNYTAPDSGLSHEQMTSEAFLDELATYASGAGPWKGSLYRLADSSGGSSGGSSSSTDLSHPDVGRAGGGAGKLLLASTGLVARLHAHGLVVHPYTLRDEQRFLIDGCSDAACEYEWLFNEGIDGAFTDWPGTLVGWLRQQQMAAAATEQQQLAEQYKQHA